MSRTDLDYYRSLRQSRMEPATAWFCVNAIADSLEREGRAGDARDLKVAVKTLMEEVANDVARSVKESPNR